MYNAPNTVQYEHYTVHNAFERCTVYTKLSNAHSKHQLPAVKTLLSNAIPALAMKYHPTIGSMEVNRYQGYLTQFKLILEFKYLKLNIFIFTQPGSWLVKSLGFNVRLFVCLFVAPW